MDARVTSNPEVMVGKPVIAGTRITVELILERLKNGDDRSQIARAYPHLPTDAVNAALDYAQSLGGTSQDVRRTSPGVEAE